MLDEGTTRRPALQLADDLETIGAEFGTGSSSDATSLGIAVLRKHGERAFDLLADVALNPSFDDKELKRLRDERLVDYQQGSQDPATVAARAFQAALYGATHPFGQLQIGTPTSLKAVSRERLQQFWRQGFVPGNAALVVSGDISATDLQVLAEKYFGQWTGTVVDTPLPATRAAAARQVLIANVPKSPQTVLEIGQIGAPRDSPDYVPLEVMNNVFGGLFSSRINLNLAEAHGYTYGASSGFAWRRGTGPFSMQASVRADATAASVAETFKELTQLRSAPVTSEELALAKDSWIRSLPANFETSSQSVASIASLYVYGLPLDYFATLPAKIGAVNAADVQRVANQYLNPATMTVVAAGDRHTILPALQKLQLGKIEFRNSEGLPAR
jgi:zinc protease